MQALASTSLRAVVLALVATACTPHELIIPTPGPCADNVEAPFPSLHQDPAPATIQKGLPRPAMIEREQTPTTLTLRAVGKVGTVAAIAVGDHGVAVVRHPLSGWSLEATGTDADLHAFGYVRYLPDDAFDGTSAEEGIVAVGTRGEAHLRRRGGRWSKEVTGTTSDLFAAAAPTSTTAPTFLFAAGAGGALVLRSPNGLWRSVDSGTSEDLVALSNVCNEGKLCAYGAQGSVVACSWLGDEVRRASCSVVGIDDRPKALRTQWAGSPAIRIELRESRLGFVTRHDAGSSDVAVPGASDARAVDLQGADGFIVGQNGLVIHVSLAARATPGKCPP